MKDFIIVWQPGETSIADYMTKTQPVSNVLDMRNFFVAHEEPTFPPTIARQEQLLQYD